MPATTDLLILLVFPAIIAYSAVSDLLRMTISNRVSIGLAAAYLAMAFLTGVPVETVGWHALAGALVLVLGFICFAFGWIGGGDAKIAAATALWLGFDLLPDYLLVGSFFGGILTLALLKLRSMPLPQFAAQQAWIVRLHGAKTGIPYGIALAFGALVVYPDTSWMLAVGAS